LRSGLMLACGGLSAALVIAALNYTQAGREQLLGELTRMGSDVLTIAPAFSRNVGGRARTGTIVTTLRHADLEALLRAHPEIVASAELASGTFLAKAGDFAKNGAAVAGVGADFFAMRRWAAAEGEVFNAAQERRSARVAVLGAAAARDLYGDQSAVGQRVLLNRVPFTVAGVLDARGQRLDAANEDEEIFIPVTTAERRLMNRDYDSGILLQVAPGSAIATVAAQAQALLRQRHRLTSAQEDDFQVQNQQALLAAQAEAAAQLERLVQAAGAGGLLAAGLALLALQNLALGARQRELGLQRALGASAAELFALLATEAALLALLAAGLAAAAGWAFSRWAEAWGHLPLRFNPGAAALVIAAAAAINLAGCTLAARRAARADPARLLGAG
ncbi:MAG: ABC transporter permease, partial [Terriglobales bacterium]